MSAAGVVNQGAAPAAPTYPDRPTFATLLERAVSEPGKIAEAYSAFHGYSRGNQLLAAFQCGARGIPCGPINSFLGWKRLGRHVTRGQHALSLWMPVTRKVERDEGDDGPDVITRFILTPRWFALAQTEGEPMPAPETPTWDRARALAALDVQEIPFDLPDGNVQGFARGRSIAISPVAAMPVKTTFHELGHVLLGHTGEGDTSDGADLPRSLREVEAESVALLCLESLGLEGAEYARGYVQHWLRGEVIPERSAQRIFKAADQILSAGRPMAEKGERAA